MPPRKKILQSIDSQDFRMGAFAQRVAAFLPIAPAAGTPLSRNAWLSVAGRKARRSQKSATVATTFAMLHAANYANYAGCRRCRRCRQINHHSILGVIFGYLRRSVSAYRIGTTLQFLVSLMAATDRLPIAAFWMCSLHQAIIGRRRSM